MNVTKLSIAAAAFIFAAAACAPQKEDIMMWKTPKSQWPECEAFIDRFLLGKEDVNTNVTKAEKFEGTTDLDKWIKY